MEYNLYVLLSEKTGKLYIGQTNDLPERLYLHNSNQVFSTKNKGPWKIIFTKLYKTRSESIEIETKLKRWKNKQRIMRWIEKQNMS